MFKIVANLGYVLIQVDEMSTYEVLNATEHSVKKRSESITNKQFEILRGRDGRDGVAGPQGLTGTPGPKGDAGP